MRLIYYPSKLLRVTTARSRVTGVFQMIAELTLMVSRSRTGPLRRI
jgi:hypothetical protein